MNIDDRASRAWIWPTLVALLAISASIGGLLNQFAQDDIPIIWKNPALQSLRGIGALFLKPDRPPPWIPALSRAFASAWFLLQWVLGGGSPQRLRAVRTGVPGSSRSVPGSSRMSRARPCHTSARLEVESDGRQFNPVTIYTP